ncbi:MAG TPA: ATP-binding protein [Pyrinomonadaceae bacterium]|nr:ATP-binding protein [Pyrinomonadaceae bacterium]
MLRTVWRYGLAVLTVAVALIITRSLQQYTDVTPLFYAAIVISAWFGGRGPGLLAVVLATVSLDYYFLPPLYTLRPDVKQISFLAVFSLLAVLTSWMSAKRKHAEEALRETRDELEVRVQERTAELREANEVLRERGEALQKVQTELAHVTRVMTLGELTASIAHEVNQPLAAIVTNGNACLRWLGGATPNLLEARQAVERIIKDSYRASEVISRIRTLVKKTPPRNDWLDVNEVIVEVLALAQSEANRNHVSLKQQLTNDLPRVRGDRVQLQQVILNLIINGLESIAKSKDGVRELSISSGVDEKKNVIVAVRDSGEGLDPANLDRVFDAFFTTKPDGMGMGLAISHTIIDSHGGRLWATPNSPRGAVFQFTLPTGGTETAP